MVVVEDWFNTQLGYLQCVSRCTSVRSILGHVDVIMGDVVHVRACCVIMGYMTKSRLETVYMCSALVTKVSHHQAEVESSRVLPIRDITELK